MSTIYTKYAQSRLHSSREIFSKSLFLHNLIPDYQFCGTIIVIKNNELGRWLRGFQIIHISPFFI